MKSYKEIHNLIESIHEIEMREYMGHIDNATESTLKMIRRAYKDGMLNQKEMLNAIECAIAIRIRKEIRESARNI